MPRRPSGALLRPSIRSNSWSHSSRGKRMKEGLLPSTAYLCLPLPLSTSLYISPTILCPRSNKVTSYNSPERSSRLRYKGLNSTSSFYEFQAVNLHTSVRDMWINILVNLCVTQLHEMNGFMAWSLRRVGMGCDCGWCAFWAPVWSPGIIHWRC